MQSFSRRGSASRTLWTSSAGRRRFPWPSTRLWSELRGAGVGSGLYNEFESVPLQWLWNLSLPSTPRHNIWVEGIEWRAWGVIGEITPYVHCIETPLIDHLARDGPPTENWCHCKVLGLLAQRMNRPQCPWVVRDRWGIVSAIKEGGPRSQMERDMEGVRQRRWPGCVSDANAISFLQTRFRHKSLPPSSRPHW